VKPTDNIIYDHSKESAIHKIGQILRGANIAYVLALAEHIEISLSRKSYLRETTPQKAERKAVKTKRNKAGNLTVKLISQNT